jgi:predicted HAD superfamily Cof-like phosphohydrolase
MKNEAKSVIDVFRQLRCENIKGKKNMKLKPHADVSNFELVGDFMEAFGQKVELDPTWPDFSTRELRLELIQEELDELAQAVDDRDMIQIADALTDLLYVVYGAGHSFGIDLDECFAEVHRSNMSKLGPNGKPIHREDGKVMKGPGYFEPDLEGILGAL